MFKVGQTVTLRNGAVGQVLAVNRPAPYDPVLVMVTKEGAPAVTGAMVGMLLSYGAEGNVANGRTSIFDIVTPPKPKIKQWLVARQLVGTENPYVCILSQESLNNPDNYRPVLRAVEFEYDPNDNEFTFTHPAGYFEAVDDDEWYHEVHRHGGKFRPPKRPSSGGAAGEGAAEMKTNKAALLLSLAAVMAPESLTRMLPPPSMADRNRRHIDGLHDDARVAAAQEKRERKRLKRAALSP